MEAYAQLVRAYQPMAVRLAHVIGGGATDADDAAQEGFIKAYRALDRYRDGSPFRPWLLRIVANEARNRRRAAGRRRHYELALAEDPTSDGAAPSSEVAVLSRESRRLVVDALATIPRKQRDVVVCRYLLGLSEDETSTVLGLPKGTVKSRLARGLDHLRERLGDA